MEWRPKSTLPGGSVPARLEPCASRPALLSSRRFGGGAGEPLGREGCLVTWVWSQLLVGVKVPHL